MYNDEFSTLNDNITNRNVGSRKGKSIFDKIFVINARTKGTTKLQTASNKNAEIAEKTACGMTERRNIMLSKIVMQGTVWRHDKTYTI